MISRVMTQSILGISGLMVVLTGQSGIAVAQTPASASNNPNGPEVEQIVVTATRSAQRLKDVPESTTVVSMARLHETPSQTLDEVLRDVPSVQLPEASVEQVHPTSDLVSMRGLSGNRALVLLDGVPINDPFFGFIEWALVPLDSVERVEVIRGGDSTLWGDHAMGGVINVISRQPTKDELLEDAGGGTYGTVRSNTYGSYIMNDIAKFSLDYGYSTTNGFESIPKDELYASDRRTSDHANDVIGTGDFQITPDLTAGFKVGYTVYNEFHQIVELSANKQDEETYQAHATQNFGNGLTLTALAFHDHDYFATANTGTSPGYATGAMEYIENYHHTPTKDFGGSLVLEQTSGGWLRNWEIGADIHQIGGEDLSQIFSPTGQQQRIDIGSGMQLFAGGFAQTTIKPIDALTISAAVRYQYFDNYHGYDGTPGGLGDVPAKASYAFDPRVSIKYEVTPDWAVRAAAYEAFNAPTMSQLYRTFALPNGIFYGSATLTPEKLKGGEAGVDYTNGPFTAQVTGYYNQITNLITSYDLSGAQLPPGFFFGSRNINAGGATSQGMEVAAQMRFTPQLTGELNYTLAQSWITNNPYDPTSVGKQVMNVPHGYVSGSATYTFMNGLRITPTFRYVSQQWGDNDHTLPYDAHFVLDAEGDYPINDRLQVFVQLYNLTNRQYIALDDGGSQPQLGTPFELFAGLRVSLF